MPKSPADTTLSSALQGLGKRYRIIPLQPESSSSRIALGPHICVKDDAELSHPLKSKQQLYASDNMMPLVAAQVTLCTCLQMNSFRGAPYAQSSPELLRHKTQRDYFARTPSRSNNARPKSNLLCWHKEERCVSHSHVHQHTPLRFLTLLMKLKHSWKMPTRKLKLLEFGEKTFTVIKTCLKTSVMKHFSMLKEATHSTVFIISG